MCKLLNVMPHEVNSKISQLCSVFNLMCLHILAINNVLSNSLFSFPVIPTKLWWYEYASWFDCSMKLQCQTKIGVRCTRKYEQII